MRVVSTEIKYLNIINIVNKKLKRQMFHKQQSTSSLLQSSSSPPTEEANPNPNTPDQQTNPKGNHHLLYSNLSQPSQDPVLSSQKKPIDKIVQNKLKYKKLKQKLNVLSEQIQDQGLLKDEKDITSPNKSRLLKLALELQKSLKTQSIDYPLVESILRQIQKILEHRREHDILILRGARIFNNLFAIIRRFPSLHKNEAIQSMVVLQISLKMMRVMLTLNPNRQLFLVSNQMMSVISLLNCLLMREERKIAIYCLYLLNSIIGGQNRIQLQPLLNVNIEYILYSPLLKRLRCSLEACLHEDDSSEFLSLGFKFYHLIIHASCKQELSRPIYDSQKILDSLLEALSLSFESTMQLLAQSINELTFERQSEGQEKYAYRQQQIPNFKINILLYIYKTFNLMFYVDLAQAQDIIDRNNLFGNTLYLFDYSKENFKENAEIKALCSEIILFIGSLAVENFSNQETIRKSGLLESLCNYPLEYIMQKELTNILIPTFCSVIYQNSNNFKVTFSEHSVHHVLQYINKQLNSLNQRKSQQQSTKAGGKNYSHTLSRKTSVSSLNSNYSKASISESFSTQASNNSLQTQIRFEQRFRPEYWQALAQELRKLDD